MGEGKSSRELWLEWKVGELEEEVGVGAEGPELGAAAVERLLMEQVRRIDFLLPRVSGLERDWVKKVGKGLEFPECGDVWVRRELDVLRERVEALEDGGVGLPGLDEPVNDWLWYLHETHRMVKEAHG